MTARRSKATAVAPAPRPRPEMAGVVTARRSKAAWIAAAAWMAWPSACHPSRVSGGGAPAQPVPESDFAVLPVTETDRADPGSPLALLGPGAIGAAAPQPTSWPPPNPFGLASTFAPYACPNLRRGASSHPYVAEADTSVSFVDGDDWLALVNRSPTGALSPDYAPADLVDLKDGRPRLAVECGAQRECLRHDAAVALRSMLDAMRQDGVEGTVQSAFRAFATQCWVFESWARQAHGGFCEATEQSALPGHSQHQLGTTLDLFTRSWADEGARTGRGVFRDGFGCSPGGRWLDAHSWRFGFVVPYSIHPDDRLGGSRCAARTDRPVPIDPKTGYKSEPWHVRYVGRDAAARYHAAWLASGPGTPDEITLEQWIRAQRGLRGDTEVPVCDGCQCGACATLAGDDARTPCGKASLRLDGVGRVVDPTDPPELVDAYPGAPAPRRAGPSSAKSSRAASPAEAAQAPAGAKVVVLEIVVVIPAHTPTQPPVFAEDGPVYDADATYLALAPYAGGGMHRYPDLPGAWRIAIDPVPPLPAELASLPGVACASPGAAASPLGSTAPSGAASLSAGAATSPLGSTAPPPGAACSPPGSALDTDSGSRWPWRASLASPHLEPVWNRANVVLPAQAGEVKIRIPLVVPAATRAFAVTLLRDGAEHGTRHVALP